jgi:hypothetical protein
VQRLYDVTAEQLSLVSEYEFEAGADAPMSIAVAVPPVSVEVTSVSANYSPPGV